MSHDIIRRLRSHKPKADVTIHKKSHAMRHRPTGLFSARRGWFAGRKIAIAGGLLVTALFASFMYFSQSNAADQLTWSPPGFPNYAGYETRIVSSGGNQTLTLDYNKDYIIKITTKISRLAIGGGRNIVIIGGHISTPDKGVVPKPPGDRWGLWIDDRAGRAGSGELFSGRVIHVEGVLIDGIDLSDAINIRAPSAILQLQNVRTGLSKYRSDHDKDGTGPYGTGGPSSWTHADSFQPHGGVKELRTDKVTMLTGYQGIFTKADGQTQTAAGGSQPVTSRHASYRLSRTNIVMPTYTTRGDDPSNPVATGAKSVTGHTALWIPTEAPHDQKPGKFYLRDFYVERNNDNPAAILWPRSGANIAQPNGDASWSFPSSMTHPVLGGEWVRNWENNGSGKIWKGRPAGGDFVPASAVGVNYVSPGYVGTTTPTPPPQPVPEFDLIGLTDGQTVSGRITLQAIPRNVTPEKFDFYLDNVLVNADVNPIHCLGGDASQACNSYDTTQLTDGPHEISVVMTHSGGVVDKLLRISVANMPAVKPGDTNNDGAVNGLDLSKVLSSYGVTVTGPANGDVNNDGIVNGLDLSVVLGSYGT